MCDSELSSGLGAKDCCSAAGANMWVLSRLRQLSFYHTEVMSANGLVTDFSCAHLLLIVRWQKGQVYAYCGSLPQGQRLQVLETGKL